MAFEENSAEEENGSGTAKEVVKNPFGDPPLVGSGIIIRVIKVLEKVGPVPEAVEHDINHDL